MQLCYLQWHSSIFHFKVKISSFLIHTSTSFCREMLSTCYPSGHLCLDLDFYRHALVFFTEHDVLRHLISCPFKFSPQSQGTFSLDLPKAVHQTHPPSLSSFDLFILSDTRLTGPLRFSFPDGKRGLFSFWRGSTIPLRLNGLGPRQWRSLGPGFPDAAAHREFLDSPATTTRRVGSGIWSSCWRGQYWNLEVWRD